MPVGQVPTPQASHQASQARPGQTSWQGDTVFSEWPPHPRDRNPNAHASSNRRITIATTSSRVRDGPVWGSVP
jgi:hypothetical protein